jgi:hypothetical protein
MPFHKYYVNLSPIRINWSDTTLYRRCLDSNFNVHSVFWTVYPATRQQYCWSVFAILYTLYRPRLETPGLVTWQHRSGIDWLNCLLRCSELVGDKWVLLERYWQEGCGTQRKLSPLLCPPQIPHRLAFLWIWASALNCLWLFAWVLWHGREFY